MCDENSKDEFPPVISNQNKFPHSKAVYIHLSPLNSDGKLYAPILHSVTKLSKCNGLNISLTYRRLISTVTYVQNLCFSENGIQNFLLF